MTAKSASSTAPLTSQSTMTVDALVKALESTVDPARLKKAVKMLKADRFKLFAQVDDNQFIGVVKSQTDLDLVYSCRLTDTGHFSCCTQNLYTCGGLRGKLCKHLLVLMIGLAQSGELVSETALQWANASLNQKPKLEEDMMSSILLQYKGAEAGEVDWRPIETIPEDYYAF